jgi:hypothetical protein
MEHDSEDILGYHAVNTRTTLEERIHVLDEFLKERGFGWKSCIGTYADSARAMADLEDLAADFSNVPLVLDGCLVGFTEKHGVRRKCPRK